VVVQVDPRNLYVRQVEMVDQGVVHLEIQVVQQELVDQEILLLNHVTKVILVVA
jgi:hypothetical protein